MSYARALVRGWGLHLSVALILITVAVLAVSPTLFPLPRLFTTANLSAPMVSVGSLVLAVIVLSSAEEPAEQLVKSAPLSRRMASPLRTTSLWITGVALLWLLTPTSLAPSLASSSALLGEGLVVSSLVGVRFGWTFPTMHVMVAIAFGAAGRLELAPWAWVISPQVTAASLCVSLGLLAIGQLTWFLRLVQEEG